MPTTIGYTGQRRDTGLGSLMFYNARYYSPLLSRFVSADTVVPNGDKASVIPLTVDFHEPMFLAGVAEENAFMLQNGFWSQLSDRQKEKAKLPWGPQNPQELNRYTYTSNNPLRYTDPSGHCPQCGVAGGLITFGGPVGMFVGGAILLVSAIAIYAGIVWMSENAEAEDAVEVPVPESGVEEKSSIPINIDGKIGQQLEPRGWTTTTVAETVNNPARTGVTTDDRNDPGVIKGEPATAYGNADGSYVVRNDRTGDIVQVSDRTRPWIDDSRIKWE